MEAILQNDKNLNDIVTLLKNHFKPEKVYLFGSQANGKATKNSDYDLLIILKSSDKDSIENMREARRILWDNPSAIDVFIFTEKEFNESKERFSSIAHTVTNEGVEL